MDNIEEIKRNRMEKFKSLGVAPTFTQDQVVQAENQSVGGTKNSSTRDRINAIKNGAMRGFVQETLEAKGPSDLAPSSGDFRPSKTHPNQRASKEDGIKKLGLDKSSKQDNRQAMEMEAMFETGSSSNYSGDVVMGNSWNERRDNAQSNDGPLISEINTPSDWESKFQNKLSSHQKGAQTQNIHKKSSEVVYEDSFNISEHYEEIYKIASDIVDKRMGSIITEIMKVQNKPQESELTYKRVRGKKSGEIIEQLISINDKIYKIEEYKR